MRHIDRDTGRERVDSETERGRQGKRVRGRQGDREKDRQGESVRM